jgi:hypothetical protein
MPCTVSIHSAPLCPCLLTCFQCDTQPQCSLNVSPIDGFSCQTRSSLLSAIVYTVLDDLRTISVHGYKPSFQSPIMDDQWPSRRSRDLSLCCLWPSPFACRPPPAAYPTFSSTSCFSPAACRPPASTVCHPPPGVHHLPPFASRPPLVARGLPPSAPPSGPQILSAKWRA